MHGLEETAISTALHPLEVWKRVELLMVFIPFLKVKNWMTRSLYQCKPKNNIVSEIDCSNFQAV